jgi:hypothetical protein
MVRSTHVANCSNRWPVRAWAVQPLFKGIDSGGGSTRPGPKEVRGGHGKELARIALGQMAYTAFQVLSGLNRAMARATAAVLGPRSFWYTTPSWFTMKVMTPELPQLAG